jgi:hypothetical protein
MHYLSTSAPCDNNSAPFHLSYLLEPTSLIPAPSRGRYRPLCEPLVYIISCVYLNQLGVLTSVYNVYVYEEYMYIGEQKKSTLYIDWIYKFWMFA